MSHTSDSKSRVYDPFNNPKGPLEALIFDLDNMIDDNGRSAFNKAGIQIYQTKNQTRAQQDIQFFDFIVLAVKGDFDERFNTILQECFDSNKPVMIYSSLDSKNIPKKEGLIVAKKYTPKENEELGTALLRMIETLPDSRLEAQIELDLKKQTILVVEDDVMTASLLLDLLRRKMGVNAIGAKGFYAARKLLDRYDIDIVITDINDSDYRVDIKYFLRDCSDLAVKVIILTGAVYSEEGETPMVSIPKKPSFLKGLEFLSKPVNLNVFKESVQRAIAENEEKNRVLAGRRFNVLFVDDSRDIGLLVAKRLNSELFNVFFSSKTQYAKRIMREKKIDFVVIDLQGLSGSFRFIDQCLQKGLPVIIWTGSQWDEIPEADGIRVVHKPSTQREIRAALKTVAYELMTNKKITTLSAEVIQKLSNPIRHIETPIERWIGWSFSSPDATPQDVKKVSDYLTRDAYLRESHIAALHGEWSKRELDEMMYGYLKFVKGSNSGPAPKKYVRLSY